MIWGLTVGQTWAVVLTFCFVAVVLAVSVGEGLIAWLKGCQ